MRKKKALNEFRRNKKRRLFKILLIITIISFIIGLLYIAIISTKDRTLIKSSFDNYFNKIKTDNINSLILLENSIKSNVMLTIFVWILGISLIGIPVTIVYLIYKSFALGFTISSLLYLYGIRIIPVLIIFIIPILINLFLIFILTFYGINFSKKLYKYIFKHKDININKTSKIYLKFLGFLIILLAFTSILESYLIPILLKSLI